MSFTRVWIHAVWGTKYRYPYLTKEIKSKVIAHIKENAKTKNIYIDSINGHTEHLHCLICLSADTSIAKTLKLIKGESAYWINKQNLTREKFEWAIDYYASSVSESHLGRVRTYIKNQEKHHTESSFTDNYEKFAVDANQDIITLDLSPEL